MMNLQMQKPTWYADKYKYMYTFTYIPIRLE